MEQRQAEEWVPIDTLRPWRDNPRINDAASEHVKEAIERFGFLDPLIVRRETREVIAGHTRMKAAHALAMDSVPVIWLDITEAESRKLAVLHNKVAERSEWDPAKLLELAGDGLDLLEAGFTEVEVDDLLDYGRSLGEEPKSTGRPSKSDSPVPRRLSVALYVFTDEADELEELVDAASEAGETRAATILRALHAAAGR